MKIQINANQKVSTGEEFSSKVSSLATEELRRFSEQITRLEVHFSDEDGKKEGPNDKRCMIEARFEGISPIAVTERADTNEQALSGAIDKLKAKIETKIGRLRNYNR